MTVLQQHHGARITKIPDTLTTGKVPMVQGTPLSNICNGLPNKAQISEIINEYKSKLEDFERSVHSIFSCFGNLFLTFDMCRLGPMRSKYVILFPQKMSLLMDIACEPACGCSLSH